MLVLGWAVLALSCASGAAVDVAPPTEASSGDGSATMGTAGDRDGQGETSVEGDDPDDLAGEEEPPPLDLTEEQQAVVDRLLGWSAPTLEVEQANIRSYIELANRREEYVADCMNREGFDYIAMRQDFVAELIVDPDVPRGTPEWTGKYGFGMSTLSVLSEEVGPDGVGFEREWLRPPPGPDADPNYEYYHGLDGAGQVAFGLARGGDDGLGGCVGEANDAFPDPGLSAREALEEQLAELDERVKATAAYFEAAAEVDACMQVPNFTFDGYPSFEQAIREKDIELGLSFSPPDDGEEQLVIGSDSPVLPGSGLEFGSPEWRGAMVELQQFEILLATEFERCMGRSAWFARIDLIARDERERLLARNASLITETINLEVPNGN